MPRTAPLPACPRALAATNSGDSVVKDDRRLYPGVRRAMNGTRVRVAVKRVCGNDAATASRGNKNQTRDDRRRAARAGVRLAGGGGGAVQRLCATATARGIAPLRLLRLFTCSTRRSAELRGVFNVHRHTLLSLRSLISLILSHLSGAFNICG
jgi:hypothetical protein